MNFIFGLTDLPADFDIQNNPYVEFIGYELRADPDQPGYQILDDKYPLELCDEEHLAKFMEPHTFEWYDKPLCFTNRDDVVIKKNWFIDGHSFPVISLAYCRNDTIRIENEDWCHTKDEIDLWLQKHPAYFVHQVTRVESEEFENDGEKSSLIENFQRNYENEDGEWFPTLTTMTSYNFAPIEVNTFQRDSENI